MASGQLRREVDRYIEEKPHRCCRRTSFDVEKSLATTAIESLEGENDY